MPDVGFKPLPPEEEAQGAERPSGADHYAGLYPGYVSVFPTGTNASFPLFTSCAGVTQLVLGLFGFGFGFGFQRHLFSISL